jgi:hypothetical protein
MAAEAARERDEDEAHWADLACGQDTEEAEESGRLLGRAEALLDVLEMLQGSDS